MALSEKELRDIINGVHSGKYDLSNLPYSLFAHTASELVDAFEMGWGKPVLSAPDIYSPDIATFNSFRRNIWYFSGNKTVAQVRELNGLMHDQDGNRRSLYDFTKDALKVDKTFNVQHLAAEYDLTNKLAHNAREWKEIEETKDVFPLLEWVTVMDANTRHAKFNGITLPVDDTFWENHPQPLEYGCRCRKRQHRDRMVTDAATIADIPEPPKRPWHANPWRQAEIWKNSEHPYGDVPKSSVAAVNALITQESEKLFVTHASYPNGGMARVHPGHMSGTNSREVKERLMNIDVADHWAKKGDSFDLLEKAPNDVSPDGRWNRSVGDIKRPTTAEAIRQRLKRAAKQGEWAILDIDPESAIDAETIYRTVNGAIRPDRNKQLKRVVIMWRGEPVTANRGEIDRRLLDTLKKAESAFPWREMR